MTIGRTNYNGHDDCIGLGIIGNMSPANSPSHIIDNKTINTFIGDLDRFIKVLSENNSLVVHHCIDQFFYMEKVAELRVLVSTITELQSRLATLETQLSTCYDLMNTTLISDKRWLDNYQAFRSGTAC